MSNVKEDQFHFNIQCRRTPHEGYVQHPIGQLSATCKKSIEKYTNTKSDGYIVVLSDRNPDKEVCVSLIIYYSSKLIMVMD